MANYITITDITDNVIKNLQNIQAYVDLTNIEIERKAQSEGVAIADIKVPLTSTVYKWAVNYCNMIACKDKACTNNNDAGLDTDKYLVKLREIYRPDNIDLERQLNADQFTGNVSDKRAFTSTLSLEIG